MLRCLPSLFLVLSTTLLYTQEPASQKLDSIYQSDSIRHDHNHLVQMIVYRFEHFSGIVDDNTTIAFIDRCLSLFSQQNYTVDSVIGRCHYIKGILYGALLEHNRAEISMKIALRYFKNYYPENHPRIYSLYWQLSEKYFLKSELDSCEFYLEKSFMCQLNSGSFEKWRHCLILLGRLAGKQGDEEVSDVAFDFGKSYYQNDVIKSSAIHIHQSEALRTLGKFDEAMNALDHAHSMRQTINHSALKASIYLDLDSISLAISQLNIEAEKFGELTTLEKYWHHNNWGSALIQQEKYNKARKQLELALQYHLNLKYSGDVFLTKTNLLNVLVSLGEIESAHKLVSAIEDDLNDQRISPFQVQLFYIQKLRLFRRSLEDSTDIYDLSDMLAVIDTISLNVIAAREKLEFNQSRINFMEYSSRTLNIGLELCALLYERGSDEEILRLFLKILERKRGLVLYDEIAGLDESDRDLDIFLNDLASRNFSELDSSQLDSLSMVFVGLVSAKSHQLKPNTRQERDLPVFTEGRLEIHCHIGHEEDLYLLFRNRSGLSFHSITKRSWLQNFEKLLYQIGNNQKIEDDRLLRTWGEMVENHIDPAHREICFFPDQQLNFMPFDLLVLRNKCQLGDLYDINYAYSLATREMQIEKLAKGRHRIFYAPSFLDESEVAVMSDDRLASRVIAGPLFYNLGEAKSAAELVSHSQVFLGEKASKASFLNNHNSSSLVHLSTHASYSSNREIDPYILFRDYGEVTALTLSEIYNLDLSANMVVMSACETGIGEYVAGEGVMSLARGFAYAGAKSVIASLWAVNDKSTSEIMVSFYKHLKKGKRKDTALRMAKQDYLANAKNPSDLHPYYWAGFIAIGDMSPLDFGFQYTWILWVGLVTVLLFAGTLWMRRVKK